jgi:hypothetical protein
VHTERQDKKIERAHRLVHEIGDLPAGAVDRVHYNRAHNREDGKELDAHAQDLEVHGGIHTRHADDLSLAVPQRLRSRVVWCVVRVNIFVVAFFTV